MVEVSHAAIHVRLLSQASRVRMLLWIRRPMLVQGLGLREVASSKLHQRQWYLGQRDVLLYFDMWQCQGIWSVVIDEVLAQVRERLDSRAWKARKAIGIETVYEEVTEGCLPLDDGQKLHITKKQFPHVNGWACWSQSCLNFGYKHKLISTHVKASASYSALRRRRKYWPSTRWVATRRVWSSWWYDDDCEVSMTNRNAPCFPARLGLGFGQQTLQSIWFLFRRAAGLY